MVNREHKDRLFKMIFGRPENREWTLSLYNAVNGTDYRDASQIEFNTMEDVLYLGMKNDTSFLLDSYLNLYEHQSTVNPNAPVRSLMYLGRLWAKQLIGKKTLYCERLIELPVPRCVVFYNGTDLEEEECILRLSDAFPKEKRELADVELTVHLLNVNIGYNKRLMEACSPMYEYAWTVDRIRENHKDLPIEEAVDKTLREMPDSFSIKRFLLENKEEVQMSILTEWDEEEYKRLLAEEERKYGREEGRKESRKQLNELNRWLIENGRIADLERSTTDPSFQEQLIEEMLSSV